jgi:hypothetical protein
MRSYVVFVSRRAMTIQNFHKNWLLRIPRRRSTKLSERIESFRHCSCTVRCRDFALPVLTPGLQPNSERFRCMTTARAEYTRIVNHQRVLRLLRTRVPPAADRQLHIGQHMFVCREKERKYCGPFAILNLSEDLTQVTLNVGRYHRSGVFSTDCVRPAPEIADVSQANISCTLSSYSYRAPETHRAVYTQNPSGRPCLRIRSCGV